MALRLGGMTAFEVLQRMTDEESLLWYKYDAYYHSEAERLNAELCHTVYHTAPRKNNKTVKLEEFARRLDKEKTPSTGGVEAFKARLNKQLGII